VKSLYFVGIPAHISSQIISVTQNLSDGLRAVVMSSARRKFSIEGVAQFTYPSSSWRNVLPTLTMLAVVPPVSLGAVRLFFYTLHKAPPNNSPNRSSMV
jgi:hypothetical protein